MTEHDEEDEGTEKMIIEIDYTNGGCHYEGFELEVESGEPMEQRNMVWLIQCALYNLMFEFDREPGEDCEHESWDRCEKCEPTPPDIAEEDE